MSTIVSSILLIYPPPHDMSIERARSNAEPTRSNHWSSGECPVALGDRAPERRFHRQFPHTETKPFDLWAEGRTKTWSSSRGSRGEALAISIPKPETAMMFVPDLV